MAAGKQGKTAEQLDDELDKMIDEMKARKPNYQYEDGFTEDNIDHILRTHPTFMKSTPSQQDIDESPLLQGLQQLQYADEDDTPEERALAYKEDGNWHFKKKLYKKAILAYGEGLAKNCDNVELNATLFANRAASNYYLQNYGSAIKDSLQALKLDPKRVKSMIKCAQCSEALGKYEDAVTWSQKALAIDPGNAAMRDLLSSAGKNLKIAERNRRKKEKEARVRQARTKTLIDAIRRRGISLDLSNATSQDSSFSLDDALVLSSVDAGNPSHSKVHFEDDTVENLLENGRLIWPALFTYPEHKISEVVEKFHEDSTFADHLVVMFDGCAPWDTEGHYTTENIEVYYETDRAITKISNESTLGEVLSSGELTVKAGTPMFIVMSKASRFMSDFLSNWTILN